MQNGFLRVIVCLQVALAARAVSGADVDFERDIRPIFVQHCYDCHGPEAQNSDLALHTRARARLGGQTGKPILDAPLATNELYRRIAATDPLLRMPKDAAPLAADQIEKIAAWIEAGAPWPDDASSESAVGAADSAAGDSSSPDSTTFAIPLRIFRDVAARSEFRHIALYVFGALLVALLALERIRRSSRSQPNADAPAQPVRLRWIGPGLYLNLLLLSIAGLAAYVAGVAHTQRVAEVRENYERRIREFERQSGLDIDMPPQAPKTQTDVYGNPPIPERLDHPRGLSWTYYRGNCERSPKLFNSGNYRTAVFHLALCDANDLVLDFGDELPDEAFVRLEIVRAPNTPDHLFDQSIMDKVFLGTKYPIAANAPAERSRSEIVEPHQRWVARYRLPAPSQTGREHQTGLVYLFFDTPVGDSCRHGIMYDLQLADGRLSAQSDLWMGSLLWNPRFEQPGMHQSGKIPLLEWFDYRPLPEITRQTTDDPDLLGVTEHLKALGLPAKKSESEP